VKAESLGDELGRRQKQDGLTLISISFSKVYAIDFANRSLNLAPRALKNLNSRYGTVSPDGTQAAFDSCGNTPGLQELHDSKSNCAGPSDLGTAMLDGSGLRTIPEITSPSFDICWSPDASKIALSGGRDDDLEIVDSHTGKSQSIDEGAGNAFFEPRCWSRDGSLIAYTRNLTMKRTVVIYNIKTRQKTEIALGGNANWIPGTDWISFKHCGLDLQYCTYYQVRPDGSGAKVLFKTLAADTGLSWSSDGRLAAYVSVGFWAEPIGVSSRVRVWRISDNSEVWVSSRRETDPVFFQWIANKNLLSGTNLQVK
jgi:WD40 repeat protein